MSQEHIERTVWFTVYSGGEPMVSEYQNSVPDCEGTRTFGPYVLDIPLPPEVQEYAESRRVKAKPGRGVPHVSTKARAK